LRNEFLVAAERISEEIEQSPAESLAENTREPPLKQKWDNHKEYARQYMEAARRKRAPPADEFRPRPFRRVETFADPESSYNVRYAVPPISSISNFTPGTISGRNSLNLQAGEASTASFPQNDASR
jgi:hypothetical protein